MARNISLLRIMSPKYAIPLTFRMMFENLGMGGGIAGLAIGTIWAVFISERTPSSAFWVSLIQVCFDVFRGFGVGSLLGLFITFLVWHILWLSALVRVFLPIRQVMLLVMIALMTGLAAVYHSPRTTLLQGVLYIGACLLTLAIFTWNIRILEQQLIQKPKNEELVRVKEAFKR